MNISWFSKKSHKSSHLEDGFISAGEIKKDAKEELKVIHEEFKRGFEFIQKYPRSVTFFGSARFKPADVHYENAKELAGKIAKGLDYAVVTGGGPGIMEAANCGAANAGGVSLGLFIHLPHEQSGNPCVQDSLTFRYFFSRKTILTFAAEAFVFYPGGFGTLDELFDILTLVQTGKVPRVPIILIGRDYWEPLDLFIRQQMLEAHGAINPQDRDLYKITEDHDEIIEIIRKSPVRNWWKEFEK